MGNALTIFSDRDIALVKNTVGADLTPHEFDHFMHMCEKWRLDPMRRQIYAMVFKRKKKDRATGELKDVRSVTYVTGIDGYRAIADRTGCYRPGNRSVQSNPDACDTETNPLGIESATASVWKFAQGSWHEYSETVYWDEFAPLKEKWENKKPTGKFCLDTAGQWGRMGRVMLQKCAEAQALRRGWPDDFSGLYVSDEMDRARVDEMIDITPHQRAERAATEERQARLGGPAVLFDLIDGEPLQAVPVGKIHDRLVEWISDHTDKDGKTDADKVRLFQTRNVEALRQFWSHDDGAALDIKKRFAALRLTEDEAA